MLLIGSKALLEAGSDFLSDAERTWDSDWIGTYQDFQQHRTHLKKVHRIVPMNRGKTIALFHKGGIDEIEVAWEGSTAEALLKLITEHDELVTKKEDYLVAKPNLIFALKKSHRYLRDSPHFLKTMLDYRHLRECGCEVPSVLKDWYKQRVKEIYWYKHPNLNVDKKDFFQDDGVPYIFDHDTIHQAMAHYEKPAYEYFQDEDAEVKCSRKLFEECSEDIRLHAVLEESYVLALERSQIPSPGVWTPRKSFETALMKVSSSITSGWFREYAYEHYFDVRKLYNDNYVDVFWEGVNSGIVRKL